MSSIMPSADTKRESNQKRAYIQAQWCAPKNVQAFSTTRIGGYSLEQYSGFNLAEHVGDNYQTVKKNRNLLISDLELAQSPLWLEQVHGVEVVDGAGDANKSSAIQADASFSKQSNHVCVVMTADCLPVLFCNKQGTWVAAAHAGWRGLANGVIQNTIDSYQGDSSDIIAWLGPAISQKHFEVGDDVRQIFVQNNPDFARAFIESDIGTGAGKYRCDLYGISRMILAQHGIEVFGGDFCTFSEPSQFYSYRRDGETGRMVSLIWINQ